MRIGATLWGISRRRITLNEGGHFLTFYWSWSGDIRVLRIWFKPFGKRAFCFVRIRGLA